MVPTAPADGIPSIDEDAVGPLNAAGISFEEVFDGASGEDSKRLEGHIVREFGVEIIDPPDKIRAFDREERMADARRQESGQAAIPGCEIVADGSSQELFGERREKIRALDPDDGVELGEARRRSDALHRAPGLPVVEEERGGSRGPKDLDAPRAPRNLPGDEISPRRPLDDGLDTGLVGTPDQASGTGGLAEELDRQGRMMSFFLQKYSIFSESSAALRMALSSVSFRWSSASSVRSFWT